MRKYNESADIDKNCHYCEFSETITMFGDGQLLCSRRGIVAGNFSCKKFFFDPQKRIPSVLPPLPGIDDLN